MENDIWKIALRFSPQQVRLLQTGISVLLRGRGHHLLPYPHINRLQNSINLNVHAYPIRTCPAMTVCAAVDFDALDTDIFFA
jgi:hypothetical protein